MSAGCPAQVNSQFFLNDLSQYASSPGHRAYCYAEVVISFPAEAETIASFHCTHLRWDGQAEWAWVTWINTWMVDLP